MVRHSRSSRGSILITRYEATLEPDQRPIYPFQAYVVRTVAFTDTTITRIIWVNPDCEKYTTSLDGSEFTGHPGQDTALWTDAGTKSYSVLTDDTDRITLLSLRCIDSTHVTRRPCHHEIRIQRSHLFGMEIIDYATDGLHLSVNLAGRPSRMLHRQ